MHLRLLQPQLPTPVKVDNLKILLHGYTPNIVDTLISGFSFGFRIHFHGAEQSFEASNLRSALDNSVVVDAKLRKELEAGQIAGPFGGPPFPNFRVSPLGLVPKKQLGEFRMIHHLSFPKGTSVNDGIPDAETSVRYATVDDAIRLIKQAGPGCFLAKTDIQNAFRIIPINPADYHLLGIKWRNRYYYDRAMPMGCSSSCRTFETFSTAVEWIAREKLSIDKLLHLLDDFLTIASTYSVCKAHLDMFISLCNFLGIPIAPDKTFGPSTTLTFAGIELDSLRCEARLPRDKIAKCVQFIANFLSRKKVTLRELQSLLGLLNFACAVVTPGRAFLRRLIDLTRGISHPHFFIRLTRNVKNDLRVWQEFLCSFNGKSLFLDDHWSNNHKLNLFTDASGSIGFGAIFGSDWCYGKWPDEWRRYNIAILEFYPIVLSLCLWGHNMRNQCILFLTDNEALVSVINKQTSKDSDLMTFVRKLVLVCLQNNILFRAKHIAGCRNTLADSLSRFQIQKFFQLAPAHMHRFPTHIPSHLQPGSWPI